MMAISEKSNLFMVCLPSADVPLTGLFYHPFTVNNLANTWFYCVR